MTAVREKKKKKVKAVRGSGLGRSEGPRDVKVFSWSENVSVVAKGERAAEDLRGGEGGKEGVELSSGTGPLQCPWGVFPHGVGGP